VSPLLRDPRTAFLLPKSGVSPHPAQYQVPMAPSTPQREAILAAARIKPCLCRALMFPGGRSFNGAVECCFYTRFISTVNIPPQSCYLSMPCMLISAHKTGCCCRYTLTFTFKELYKHQLGWSHLCLPTESSAPFHREGREAWRSRMGFAVGLAEQGFKGDLSVLFSHRHLYRAYTLYCLEEPCTSAYETFGGLGSILS